MNRDYTRPFTSIAQKQTNAKDKLASSVRTIDLKTENDPLPQFRSVGNIWDGDIDVIEFKVTFQRLAKCTR